MAVHRPGAGAADATGDQRPGPLVWLDSSDSGATATAWTTDPAGLLEEIGWRGYALPQLLAQYSALTASLIIGVVWGSLHLALLLPGMMNEGVPALPTVLAVVSVSVLTTWLYVNTGGNLILVIVFHAAQNFFVIVNEGIPFSTAAWLMVDVYLVLALLVVVLTGRNLTSQPPGRRGSASALPSN
jgi:uncharacterized protein